MKVKEPDYTYDHHTYADYLKWKIDGRLELIKGRIFKMSPAPKRIHQEVSGKIFVRIHTYLNNKECKVYNAPFDVRLGNSTKNKEITNVVQPDICVVCDKSKLDEKGCIGAPDIIIEILSTGTNKKEIHNKYELYEESGVKEYWIIQPHEQTLLIYTLIDLQYRSSRLYTRGDEITTPVLPGFILKLDDVFEDEIE